VIRKALAVVATTLGLLLTMSGSPAHAGAICSAMDSNLHADCPPLPIPLSGPGGNGQSWY
jgi:hypothetical protein